MLFSFLLGSPASSHEHNNEPEEKGTAALCVLCIPLGVDKRGQETLDRTLEEAEIGTEGETF